MLHAGHSFGMRGCDMFLKVLDNPASPGERLVETLGKLQAPSSWPSPWPHYLCSLRQVDHGVWLEVILVLPTEYSGDDDDDNRDHGDGGQHRGDDPQVVGWILHHGCGKEPVRST